LIAKAFIIILFFLLWFIEGDEKDVNPSIPLLSQPNGHGNYTAACSYNFYSYEF